MPGLTDDARLGRALLLTLGVLRHQQACLDALAHGRPMPRAALEEAAADVTIAERLVLGVDNGALREPVPDGLG